MRLKVKCTHTEAQEIQGLSDRGKIPVGETHYFQTDLHALHGQRDGMPTLMADLLRREANGWIEFEVLPDPWDVGLTYRKRQTVSHAAGDFTAAALTQNFDADEAFPTGARYAGGKVNLVAAVANSDGAFVSSVLDVGFTDDADALMTDFDLVGGTLGDNPLDERAAATAYVGRDIGGKTLRSNVTNAGAGANIALNTAGKYVVEILYTIPA